MFPVCRFLSTDSNTPWSSLSQIKALAYSITHSTIAMPRVTWIPDMEGNRLTIVESGQQVDIGDIGKMRQELLSDMLSKFGQDVALGMSLPSLFEDGRAT